MGCGQSQTKKKEPKEAGDSPTKISDEQSKCKNQNEHNKSRSNSVLQRSIHQSYNDYEQTLQNMRLKNQNLCVVCEQYGENAITGTLLQSTCRHSYHTQCIRKKQVSECKYCHTVMTFEIQNILTQEYDSPDNNRYQYNSPRFSQNIEIKS